MGDATTSPVSWSQIERFQSNSYSDNDGIPDSNWLIHDKIKSVFNKVDSSNLKGLIQFWAPIKTKSGRLVLTTCDQPFKLEHVNNYSEYRVYCNMYQYSIDHGFDNNKGENAVLSGGPPATVFLNQLPEVVLDLRHRRVHPGESPLVQHALQCDLTSYFMLPVFYHTSSSSCVGVVECCMELSCFLKIFTEVKRALKSVGMSTFDVQGCRLYKSMPGLKRITDEIEEALVIVCESHDLPAAQVWIPYENENYLPFEPCADGTQTKGRFAVKLVGYCVDSDDRLCKSYYDTCDTFPLKIEDGLVGKTLETYQPHFCTNIYNMGRYEQARDKTLLAFLSATTRCSCFVICMRSIDTADINYAFEFFWPQTRNYLILLESMLLTLNRCLPHFNLASGARLGDELRIIDVENSTGGGGLGSFEILQRNKLSPIPKALEERRRFLVPDDCMSSSSSLAVTHLISLPREDVKQQLGRSTIETARNLTEWWQRPNFVKRKLTDVYESDTDSNEEVDNRSANQDDIISIKLECAGKSFKFYQHNSLTFAVLKKEINKHGNLNPGTYKLKYLDHDRDWILMNSDKHLRQCISNLTFVNGAHIRLRVLPLNQL